ncbi:MAG: hypothetical protein NTX36_08910 [Proteobacteria bacterium]|nr:hypothetical protein [Pseudomonadota bacterium]
MAILFVQHWDIMENKEKEYEEFILKTHIPAVEKTGLRVVGGYYVVVGAGPRIAAVSTIEDLLEFQKAVTSKEHSELLDKLFPLIRNYSNKLYTSYGPIEVERYEIQFATWKFNQYFDIIPGMADEYKEFVKDEFIPEMEKIDIKITNIWKVAIGSGPFILVEGSSPGLQDIARAVDTDEYRGLMRRLKSKYVMNYQSRIMASTRRVEMPYFIKSLTGGLQIERNYR